MANIVLESLLKPLTEFYTPSFVEEIAINHPGQVWMRLHNARVPWVAYAAPQLTKQYLLDLVHTVANIYEQPFNPINGIPVVYAELPGVNNQTHRFTAIAGPNVQYDNEDLTGGIAMNIRSGIVKDTDLKTYHLERGKPLMQIRKRESVRPDDPYDRLMQAIADGSPILISGATASGKTTILNHLLTLIDKNSRVITVEDTREVFVPQENRVHLVLSRTRQNNEFNYPMLLDVIMRMTPDVVIGGELSTSNAAAIWQLLRTGHQHFYTTIHAESAEEAYKRFAGLILDIQPAYNATDLITEMKSKIRVVQLARDGSLRAVTEVV